MPGCEEESENIVRQAKHIDEQFQIPFAKQCMDYEYSETSNGELIITLPSWSAMQYKCIRVVDEDGKQYNCWQPFKVSVMQLSKREMTGRAIRV